MKVLINGRYAYETDLDDVEVGDEMVLPGSGAFRDSWYGIVTALEPPYEGPCRKVIGLSRRRATVEAEQAALAEVRISGWRTGETIRKKCRRCGGDREYRVEDVNSLGRPTHLRADQCSCGEPRAGAGLGSADAFRHFVVDADF